MTQPCRICDVYPTTHLCDEHTKPVTKTYNLTHNVGRVKYLVSYHDGETTHKDGSPFYDVRTFSNKKLVSRFIREIEKLGYVYA